ncbi:nucleotidyltransferase domain-containing protein [Kangiella sp. M94]
MSQLADLLFKEQRRRILGLLLLKPEARYHVREIARLTNLNAGSTQRELKKLAEAELLIATEQGNQLLYQANRNNLIFEELSSILRKTSGLADVLRGVLAPLSGKIDVAFVFGSMASGKASQHSDIDLCVVGKVTFLEVVKAVYPAQETLAREINPKCFTPAQWQEAMQENSVFIKEILEKDVINIIGDRDDLKKSSGT